MSQSIFNNFTEYATNRSLIQSKENFIKFVILEGVQEIYLKKSIVTQISYDESKIFYTNDGFIIMSVFDEENNDLVILFTKEGDIPFETDLEINFLNIQNAIDEIVRGYGEIYEVDINKNLKIYNLSLGNNKLAKDVFSFKNYKINFIDKEDIKRGLSYKYDDDDSGKHPNLYKLELAQDRNNLLRLNIPNSYDLIVAPVYVRSLVPIWKNSYGKVLDKNLRLYVKDKKIDDAIKKSLTQSSKEFVVYNNGLTIISEDIDLNHDGNFLKFDDFHIINGGQTTKLIFDTFESLRDVRDLGQIAQSIILVKIILFKNKNKRNSERIISKITEATNLQKKIENQDFLANNPNLLNWGDTFNIFFKDALRFSVKRNDSLPKDHTTIKLWDFIEIIASTFWWEPHSLKGRKGSIFDKDKEIIKSITNLKLEDRNTRIFIYDLWFINKAIQERIISLKKNTKKTSNIYKRNIALTKILNSGRFLILNIIFAFYIFYNSNNLEINDLLGILNSDFSTNDKISKFFNFSKNISLKPILNRGKNYAYEKVDFIPEETEKKLKLGLTQLAIELLKKFENSLNLTDKTDVMNWGGLGNSFGDVNKNLNIIKDVVNQFLMEENDVLDPIEPYVKSFKDCFDKN